LDNFIEIKKCPVCNSNNNDKAITAIDYLVTKGQFDILECKDCKLRFTSPIPDENEMSKYYKSDEYISHSEEGNSLINKIYKIVQKITLRSKKKTAEKYFNNKKGSVLDFGCGTGDFLNTMKKSGWSVTGVEIDESARKIAEGKIGNCISYPSEFLNDSKKYDVITLWHSLEHLYDLKKCVQKISTSLNANGVLIIAVPNYQSLDAEYYIENWAAYDVPRHLYHFTFKSMTRLFNEYGYEIINCKQLPFDPFYVSLLSEVSVKGKRIIFSAIWIGLKSYIGGVINAKRGSSILYVLKK